MASSAVLVRRSKLVVSPLDRQGVEEAAHAGADAIVLDLVETTPPSHREEARRALPQALSLLSSCGADLLLWTAPETAADDLAVLPGGLAGVLYAPQAPEEVRRVEEALGRMERRWGLPAGSLRTELVVSSPRAVWEMEALLSAGGRWVAVNLEEGGLLAEMGREPPSEVDLLLFPRGRMVVVARLYNIQACALAFVPGGGTLQERARRARRLGLWGALCFTPGEVPALNEGFRPTPEEVEHARQVTVVMEEAQRQGKGSASLPGGEMVDLAMLKHARALLAWAEAIEEKEARKVSGRRAER